MRRSVALGCLLLVGCAGPHSTGALWAQQNLEQETAVYRLSEAQRADRAHAFELGLADDVLTAERTRIEASLQACPGKDREQLSLSVGDRARDSVRLRAQDDPARMTSLAQVALADWRVRRARATGDATMCDAARQALAGLVGMGGGSDAPAGAAIGAGAPEPRAEAVSVAGASDRDVLAELGSATVTRDARHGRVADATWPARVALSNYALGYVDTVQAVAPLPAYLAAVYGGELLGADPDTVNLSVANDRAALVDRIAPAYPEWEPDALYAALVAGQT